MSDLEIALKLLRVMPDGLSRSRLVGALPVPTLVPLLEEVLAAMAPPTREEVWCKLIEVAFAASDFAS